MGEHTELPWQAEQGTDLIWGACTPEGEVGYPIVEGKLAMWTRPLKPNGKEREANAAYIVKCVNAHEGLVKALKEAREALGALGHPNGVNSGLAWMRGGKTISAIIDAALASLSEGK